MPARLRPTAPIAADAILVGDPARAMLLAQELLTQPKMSNHARGLWGYSGTTPAGRELTVQSTGMGGPSATVVLADLAELGVRRAIRIGTCTSLAEFTLGDLVVVTNARSQPCRGEVAPDRHLSAALHRGLGEEARSGDVVSLDALHRHEPDAALDGDVTDMQTASLLAAGSRLGVAIAAVLIVVDEPQGEELGDETMATAAKRAGGAAASVLSA
jgi:purine-nucleoside phosphorylase